MHLCLLQSAIWQCLNNYDYADAVFLSERLYAEGEEVLFYGLPTLIILGPPFSFNLLNA